MNTSILERIEPQVAPFETELAQSVAPVNAESTLTPAEAFSARRGLREQASPVEDIQEKLERADRFGIPEVPVVPSENFVPQAPGAYEQPAAPSFVKNEVPQESTEKPLLRRQKLYAKAKNTFGTFFKSKVS